jgi:hypothetical protein
VNDGPDSFGVIVGGQADEDVDFANVDQLAKKIICKKALLCQFHLPFEVTLFRPHLGVTTNAFRTSTA